MAGYWFTDQNWAQDVLGADKPVLVDFWAEWCAPRKAMVPDLEAVAAQYSGEILARSDWPSPGEGVVCPPDGSQDTGRATRRGPGTAFKRLSAMLAAVTAPLALPAVGIETSSTASRATLAEANVSRWAGGRRQRRGGVRAPPARPGLP